MMTQTKQAIGNDSSHQMARAAVILGSTLLIETLTLCVNLGQKHDGSEPGCVFIEVDPFPDFNLDPTWRFPNPLG